MRRPLDPPADAAAEPDPGAAAEIPVRDLAREREAELRASAARDQSERIEAQTALQAQLDVEHRIGELSRALLGGIAHDINNQLTVMLVNARYAMRRLAPDDEVGFALADLHRAAQHCAQLTRGLLAFSRRTPISPRPLDVIRVIEEAEELLRPATPPGRGSVLVVEDEDGVQRTLARALREGGYEVVEAGEPFSDAALLEALHGLLATRLRPPEERG